MRNTVVILLFCAVIIACSKTSEIPKGMVEAYYNSKKTSCNNGIAVKEGTGNIQTLTITATNKTDTFEIKLRNVKLQVKKYLIGIQSATTTNSLVYIMLKNGKTYTANLSKITETGEVNITGIDNVSVTGTFKFMAYNDFLDNTTDKIEVTSGTFTVNISK